MLNKHQDEAVRSDAKVLIVLAGPGSGKTRVIIEKLRYLTTNLGVPSDKILALTFTNKAALEIRERYSSIENPFVSNKVWISTFHSLGLNMLRSNFKLTKLKSNFTLIDADDSKKIYKNILGPLGLQYDKYEFKDLLNSISQYRNGSKSLSYEQEVVYTAYRTKLNDIGAIDYDDILSLSYQLLNDNPSILEKYRERFAYLLVDEFQDTNKIQHQIINLFLGYNAQTMLVGDVDQSIYGWRNANPRYILQLLPKAKVIQLRGNYRSTENIVELCNSLISNNHFAERDPMVSKIQEKGDVVEYYRFSDSRREAEVIVNRLKNKAGSKAVLIRTNSMSREIEDVLNQQGVPYRLVGGTRFYERAEIKDALAYIKLALNPFDALSFERIVNTPKRKIGSKSIDKIDEFVQSENSDYLKATTINFSKNTQATKFVSHIATVKSLLSTSLIDALKYVYNEIGLLEYYRNEVDTRDTYSTKSGNTRVSNLQELLSAVEEFNHRSVAYLDGIEEEFISPEEFAIKFLENAMLNSSKDELNPASLEIMTIHSAKGREFETVWVPALEESILPHYLPGEEPDVEEERRLLFVACSRAKSKLYLSSSFQRFRNGALSAGEQSRFFDEIDVNLEIFDDSHNFGSKRWSKDVKTYSPINNGRLKEDELRSVTSGTKVEHPVFGFGTVVTVDEKYLTVEFADSRRILDGTKAPLTVVL